MDTPATRDTFRSLFKSVSQNCSLPPLPRVAVRALALARDPKVSSHEVARVVADDPALAARVLKLSRSVTYLKQDPPKTVHDAVVTVGFEKLRGILIAASARSMYGARDRAAETLWAHALATALAADEMREAKEPRGGAPFIAGLLHDIGRLVFHLTDPAAFARLGHWDEALERELYGVTHAIVGGVLVDMWRVGEGVAEAILEHHLRPARGLAARVAIADWVAHHIGLGSVPGEIPPVDTVEGLPADLESVAERVARTFETERAFFD